MPVTIPAPVARLIASACTALLLMAALAGPVVASRPYNHVIASIDGFGAAALAVSQARVDSLERQVVTSLTFGRNRVHTRGEQPAGGESTCLSMETYWLPADGSSDEYLAVKSEAGCLEVDGVVDVDVKVLTYGRLAATDLTLELQYCSAQPGVEWLCEGAPAVRVVAVAADLTGMGELTATRGHDRYEVPFAPNCVELDVFSNSWRAGDGTIWLDGTPSAVDPALTFLFDGELYFHVLCRE